LRTLDRHSPFKVIAADESQVRLRLSTGKVRSVRREEVEGAFSELRRTGEIDLKAIEKRHSPRSISYVAAMLAQLEGVSLHFKPVRLSYSVAQTTTEDARERKKLSTRSTTVLKLIAEGRTYEQILTLCPELTYPDIFAAAREALEVSAEIHL
jgi:hypothetical protein